VLLDCDLGLCGQWGVLLGVVVGYLAVLVILGALLPGRTIAGAVLADKSRLYYKCNGDNSLCIFPCANIFKDMAFLYATKRRVN